MVDELEELRQKKLDALTENMGITVMPKKEEQEQVEDDEFYDLVLPGWIPPWVAEKAAPEVGAELVEREIQGTVSDPETETPSDMTKNALCVRGSLDSLDQFKRAAVKHIQQFIKGTGERKLTKPSNWWKHYHIDEWDDVKKDASFDYMEEWKRFEKAGRNKVTFDLSEK